MNKVLIGAVSFSLMTTVLTMAYLANKPEPVPVASHPVCVETGEYRIGANAHKVCTKQLWIANE